MSWSLGCRLKPDFASRTSGTRCRCPSRGGTTSMARQRASAQLRRKTQKGISHGRTACAKYANLKVKNTISCNTSQPPKYFLVIQTALKGSRIYRPKGQPGLPLAHPLHVPCPKDGALTRARSPDVLCVYTYMFIHMDTRKDICR